MNKKGFILSFAVSLFFVSFLTFLIELRTLTNEQLSVYENLPYILDDVFDDLRQEIDETVMFTVSFNKTAIVVNDSIWGLTKSTIVETNREPQIRNYDIFLQFVRIGQSLNATIDFSELEYAPYLRMYPQEITYMYPDQNDIQLWAPLDRIWIYSERNTVNRPKGEWSIKGYRLDYTYGLQGVGGCSLYAGPGPITNMTNNTYPTVYLDFTMHPGAGGGLSTYETYFGTNHYFRANETSWIKCTTSTGAYVDILIGRLEMNEKNYTSTIYVAPTGVDLTPANTIILTEPEEKVIYEVPIKVIVEDKVNDLQFQKNYFWWET